MDLASRFLGYSRKHGLVSEGERVLVAVSGGVDSVVLLHLFKAAGFDIVAAHFDHAMRPDSGEDAAWVAALCEAWSVPLVTARAGRKLASETEARIERYGFLMDALRSSRARRAATAHHFDDQVETVLMRLLRGAGLRGLSGIPIRRGPFIRPLLRFRKTELLQYAADNGISFREDATNAQNRFMRNRVRNVLLPALDEVRPNARAAIARMARYAARTEKAWHAALQRMEAEIILHSDAEKIELARDVFLEYDAPLRARVIRHFLRRFGALPSRASTHHILNFCANAESGSALEVAGRVMIERTFDRLRISRTRKARRPVESLIISGPEGSAGLTLAGSHYAVTWSRQAAPADFTAAFDAALLQQPLELRAWRPGDRVRMPYGTKKLKKLFAERRIAVSDRARVPVLVDQHGEVLWVASIARSVHALAGDREPVLNIMVANAQLS